MVFESYQKNGRVKIWPRSLIREWLWGWSGLIPLRKGFKYFSFKIIKLILSNITASAVIPGTAPSCVACRVNRDDTQGMLDINQVEILADATSYAML